MGPKTYTIDGSAAAKEISWMDRMCDKFCELAEPGRGPSLLFQETSKYVEGQMNTVRASLSKICTEFVQELLTPPTMPGDDRLAVKGVNTHKQCPMEVVSVNKHPLKETSLALNFNEESYRGDAIEDGFNSTVVTMLDPAVVSNFETVKDQSLMQQEGANKDMAGEWLQQGHKGDHEPATQERQLLHQEAEASCLDPVVMSNCETVENQSLVQQEGADGELAGEWPQQGHKGDNEPAMDGRKDMGRQNSVDVETSNVVVEDDDGLQAGWYVSDEFSDSQEYGKELSSSLISTWIDGKDMITSLETEPETWQDWELV